MQAVVIAAGESKRFWPLNNGIHKSQFKLLGKSLLYWTLKGLAENNITEVIVVVSKNSSIQEMLAQENDLGINIAYATQEEPLGTGNALWQAREFVTEPFILLWGNKVRSGDIVKQMVAKQKQENADVVLGGAEVSNPQEYGILRLEQGRVVEIVENPEQGKEPSNMALLGIRLLQPDFFAYYEKLTKHHEADLVDATNAYIKDKKVSVLSVEGKGLTLKYPWDLFSGMDALFAFREPLISPSANIGKNVVMEGPVYIGDNCTIGSHNVLRGPLNLEENVKTGAFMEMKHSIVQKDTHFHSGYLGDSIVGENCRFGAGFISANRRFDRANVKTYVKDKKVDTGLDALGCVVGNNTSFGIHSGTMPGVMIGAHCKVGPGTHVFENLEDNATFYTKESQIRTSANEH